MINSKECHFNFERTLFDQTTPSLPYSNLETNFFFHVRLQKRNSELKSKLDEIKKTLSNIFEEDQVRHFQNSYSTCNYSWQAQVQTVKTPGGGGGLVQNPRRVCFFRSFIIIHVDYQFYDDFPI